MSPTNADLAQLLIDLGRSGVTLGLTTDSHPKLRHKPARLDPEIVARLLLFKTHAFALLRLGYGPADDAAQGAFDERLGVAAENGLPVDRGCPAWLIAVGESMLAQIGGGN